MKNFNLKNILGLLLLFAISAFALISCSDDDGEEISTSPPVIEKVSTAVDDEATTVGYADNMYIIRGKGFSTLQKVYFNDTDTYFNPTLVTENVIFVTIDRDTPYADVPNELRIVTKYGTGTYEFVVAPPAPEVKSINPVNAADGETVTIYGSYFLDPVVTFGTIPATVISSTMTEIQVQVPTGGQLKQVTVTTLSGDDSSWEKVGTALFDDTFYYGFMLGDSSASIVTDAAGARQGTKYIKSSEIGGWGNFGWNWAWYDTISGYNGIRLSIKADNPGEIQLIFNGNWGANFATIPVTTGWQDIEIPWATFGGMPAAFQNITVKNNKPDANVFYLDNVGFM